MPDDVDVPTDNDAAQVQLDAEVFRKGRVRKANPPTHIGGTPRVPPNEQHVTDIAGRLSAHQQQEVKQIICEAIKNGPGVGPLLVSPSKEFKLTSVHVFHTHPTKAMSG